jgi:hypothetical protein
MCSIVTYRLEDGNLSTFKVMVGLDVLAVIAVDVGQLRRHPLIPLIVVFAGWGRQGGFGCRIVEVDRRFHRRHDVGGRLHGKGRCVARRLRVLERWGLAGVVRERPGARVHRYPRHRAHAWEQNDRRYFAGCAVVVGTSRCCCGWLSAALGTERGDEGAMGEVEVQASPRLARKALRCGSLSRIHCSPERLAL